MPDVLKKIEERLPDFKTFESRIRTHLQKEYFPTLYQSLYLQITPEDGKFSTDDFKELLNKRHCLELLNDIYRTRLSNDAFAIIRGRIKEVDFDNYKSALRAFEGCDRKGTSKKANALSFGTKVLHTFNPEKNPILDSVVRKNLKINDELTIELCLEFREAMNDFVNAHENYFSEIRKSSIFREFSLKPDFPKMNLLDMALY